jgi:ribosome biogenesis protein MAK21
MLPVARCQKDSSALAVQSDSSSANRLSVSLKIISVCCPQEPASVAPRRRSFLNKMAMGKKRKASEAYGDAPKPTNGTGRPAAGAHQPYYKRPRKAKLGGGKRRRNFVSKTLRKCASGINDSQVFPPRPDWHAAELPALQALEAPSSPPSSTVEALKEYAISLLAEENGHYNSTVLANSSSNKFMTTIMASGTLEDRVSALTLVAQESPLHTMKTFENLIGLARKKSRNQALMALAALKDLLGQGVVLPPDRKLRAFGRQPGLISALQGQAAQWRSGDALPGGITELHLITWAYEDWLKHTYFEVLKVLESWCNDEVEFARSRSTTFVCDLLKEKPEQEENLLRLLVNKLGDANKKVASRASYLLLQLQVTHPMMKEVIMNAIESEMLFRPGQNLHAKYYAITTLNQTVLSPREPGVANKLLEIYFSLFLSLLKTKDASKKANPITNANPEHGGGKPGKMAKKKAEKKAKEEEAARKCQEELEERMTAQLLSGVNRAFPFSQTDDKTFESQLDTIFRITHSSNFNTSIQALMLIQQISAAKQYAAERYYRTLYESLLDPRLLTSSKQILYLNLLYRSLKADINVKRVKAFVKRLLQIVTLHEPSFICGVLHLIHELEVAFPSIQAMLDQPGECAEGDEEHFVDVPEDAEGKRGQETETANKGRSKFAYNGRKRIPEYSNADRSCLWELIPLQAHFHPTISLYASRVLSSEKMQEKPDPSMHTLMHFLDRFVYRNPKSKPPSRGISIMQPMAGGPDVDLLIRDRTGAQAERPLNSESFWQRKKEKVSVDEVFFHQYFAEAGKKKNRQERRAGKVRNGDNGSDESEDEDEIWKALVGSKPDVEGEDEELDELDMVDFMSDEDEAAGNIDDDVEIHETFDSEDEDVVPEAGAGAGADENLSGSDSGVAELESGDEAVLSIDEELPAGSDIPFGGFDDDSDDQAKAGQNTKSKRDQRKMFKSLPVFASTEDYAKLLEQDDDEDM